MFTTRINWSVRENWNGHRLGTNFRRWTVARNPTARKCSNSHVRSMSGDEIQSVKNYTKYGNKKLWSNCANLVSYWYIANVKALLNNFMFLYYSDTPHVNWKEFFLHYQKLQAIKLNVTSIHKLIHLYSQLCAGKGKQDSCQVGWTLLSCSLIRASV